MSRSSGLLAGLILALILLLPQGLQPPTPAAEAASPTSATITVNTAAELQQAILDANSETGQYAGPDTIVLGQSITLSAADTVNASELGGAYAALPDITSAITLHGDGNTLLRDLNLGCDTTSEFRFLNVLPGGSLTLADISLLGGCVYGDGGSIYNQGTLALTDASQLLGAEARALSGDNTARGGAIYNDNGALTITGSQFSSNSASNFGLGSHAGQGGVIYNTGDNAQLTIETSSFQSNAVGGNGQYNAQGAAIFHGSSSSPGTATLIIRESAFTGNDATGTSDYSAWGGAVRAADPVDEISLSFFWQNEVTGVGLGAGRGGAVAASSSLGIFYANTLLDNTITANGVDGGWGGGMYLAGPATTISSNTFSTNETSNSSNFNRGGALLLDGPVTTLSNNTFYDNVVNGGGGYTTEGGAVYLGAGAVNVTHNTLYSNTATMGGSFFITGAAITNLSNNLLVDNTPGCNSQVGPQSNGYNVGEPFSSCGFVQTGDYTGAITLNEGLTRNDCTQPYPAGIVFQFEFCRNSINPVGTPAVDAGSCALSGQTRDGRGFSRAYDVDSISNADDACDIGAYEFVEPVAATIPPAGQPATFYGPLNGQADGSFDIKNAGPPGSMLDYGTINLPAGFNFAAVTLASPLAAGEQRTIPLLCLDTWPEVSGTVNFTSNDPNRPMVYVELECGPARDVNLPTILHTASDCSSFSVDYLAQGGLTAGIGYLMEVYRELPGGTDMRVAFTEQYLYGDAPAGPVDERYSRTLGFGRSFPPGTAFYLVVYDEGDRLETPAITCGE
jgi:hypothetical protein